MEAVDLVVTALTVGAAAGAKDTATSAAKDAYAALAKLRLTDRTQAAIFGLQQRLVPLDEALDQLP